jgi:hypothetical protein
VYDSVGVRFKGATSYSQITTSDKKSFNISLDYKFPNQSVNGYKTLNLNNCFDDPSFIREVFFLNQIRNHIPGQKASYIRLIINGANWGLYPNVQQLNGEFYKEWFQSNKGTNWRGDRPPGVTGPPGGWGDGTTALNYLGTDTTQYQKYYTLNGYHKADPWGDLIKGCQILNQTPLSTLESVGNDYFDIDRTLWFLATEILFSDDDSYVYKGKMDYWVYYEAETGRLTPIQYDANTVMKTNAVNWSPFYNETKVNYPLMNRLFAVPELRQRYLAHMRVLINEYFNVPSANLLIDNYKNQIDTVVQNDPKKLYSYAAFQSEITTLKNFVNNRRNNLMANSEVAQPAPSVSNVQYDVAGITWKQPASGEAVNVRANVTSYNGISKVQLYFSPLLTGKFSKVQMFDDGLHNDSLAGDGIYGATIPGHAAGKWVRFYVEAAANNPAKTVTYYPPGAEHNVMVYYVAPVQAASSPVVINELMALNTVTAMDSAGQYDDWIELFNRSNQAIDLSGFYITDDTLNITKWSISQGTILQPNEYLIFWADEDGSQGNRHCNFKLSASGDELMLLNPSLEVVDKVVFGTQQADMGLARVPNGTGNFIIQGPTFSVSNNTVGVSEAAIPEFSMLIFPNPALNRFTVRTKGFSSSNLLIYNAIGQLMFESEMNTETEIESNSWPAGLYFVKAGSQVQKLVVQMDR